MATLREWWSFLVGPWRTHVERDDFDIDVLGHLHRLETRMGTHRHHCCDLELRVEALERAHHHLVARTNRLENHMATQDDIDALTVKLGELRDTLTADDAGIQAEIDALKAANPAVDVSALQAAVDNLSSQVDATTALVAAPADTPPAA